MAEPAKEEANEEANEEEVEYDSDPEETKLTLKMRRREASDDEEEGDVMEEKVKPSRRIVECDVESDGQGGAADYDEEEGEDDEEYVEEEELIVDDEEYVDEGEVEYVERGGKVGSVADDGGVELRGEGSRGPREGIQDLNEDKMDENILNDDSNREQEEEEGKKENEPYAVPTAGAFYMHDDRFRDNAGGRGRRTFAGRKLWESKDEKKWGHDKFEEFTSQERHYEGGRRGSRGRFRGRGRFRSQERGYAQGNSSRGGFNTTNDQSRVANNINAPRTVRGRGPRRYQQTSYKNNNEAPNQNQQPGKSAEKSSHSGSTRMSTSQPNVEPESAPVKKNTFASSLNYASPPFYPSGSSSDVTFTQKRDGHPVGTNQNVRHVADQSSSAMHPGSMPRRRAAVDSMGMDKLYIDDSLPAVAGKHSNPLQLPVSSSSALNSNQSFQLKGQGRGTNSLPQMTYQPTGNRIPSPAQHSIQRNPVVSQGQSSGQQYAQSSRGGSQVSSPKASQSESSFEPAEVESLSESINSKTSVVSKGKVNVQGSGRGSFLYGGAPIMGASGSLGGAHGDQNFPAFLPVMQFAGQRPGGMGVPAVGMAFPGYVAQPQLGLGNSEMTWLPVLTGAAGALHATYGSPYMNADGSYQGRPAGQSSSSVPMIKENTANKPNSDLNPTQRHEAGNDEFSQRQKNPRRYTEMKFDH